MFYCNNCHDVFDDVIAVLERHGLQTPPYEKIYISNCCGDTDFEEATVCEKCGKYIPFSQSKYGMCPDCEELARERFRYIWLNEFDEREREYLFDCFDSVVAEDVR